MSRPQKSKRQIIDPALLQAVQAVYRELEQRPVERDCQLRTDCCRFKLTGLTPYVTKGEALLAARAYRASGRTALPAVTDGACPLLNRQTGKCTIYENRPFACRTHFCTAAGGPYARREVADLIRKLEAIDASLGGDGGRMLPGAVETALQDF